MFKSIRSLLFVAAVAMVSTSSANAVLVDYLKLDVGPNGQDVEAGFVGLTAPVPNANVNNTTYGPTAGYTSLFGGDALSVQLSSVDWRDRGNGPDVALGDIGEDFVKNNGGIVTLTLSGLRAGTYEATSWHYDSGFTQSDQIEIAVSGGGVLDQSILVGDAGVGAGGTGAITTARVDSSRSLFSFVANGIDPVVLTFDGSPSGDNETPLNGLQLQFDQAVPEPATATLGLMALVGLARRRRRIA